MECLSNSVEAVNQSTVCSVASSHVAYKLSIKVYVWDVTCFQVLYQASLKEQYNNRCTNTKTRSKKKQNNKISSTTVELAEMEHCRDDLKCHK